MTKNRDIATQIGRSIAADNLDSTGSFLTTGSQGVIVYGADYTASSDLAAVDSSTLADGSLHYLSKLNEMYIWDDSDGAFYSITLDSAWASAGGGYTFQGSVSGYTSGGRAPSSNVIDKFPFSADANATDVGDLTAARYDVTGQSSTASGYSSGGNDPNFNPTPITNMIDKFPFSADANATDVGDLTSVRYAAAGQSSSTSGYTSGGRIPGYSNVIDKFPFATDANATDVGDMTISKAYLTGQSSADNGYNSGGLSPVVPGTTNVIEKFPFSTDANATDVGDLTAGRYLTMGQSSTASGYNSGGTPNVSANYLDKFSFSSDANATDVGGLSVYRYAGSGQSSTDNGYSSGGAGATPVYNIIDKFPFSTDANATDVGDLTVVRRDMAGQQV